MLEKMKADFEKRHLFAVTDDMDIIYRLVWESWQIAWSAGRNAADEELNQQVHVMESTLREIMDSSTKSFVARGGKSDAVLIWCRAAARICLDNLYDGKNDSSFEEIERLKEQLRQIGDFAHDKSTGPAVPDALWKIRSMAYDGI